MMLRLHRGVPYVVRWNNVPYPEGRTAFLLNGKCGNSSVKAAVLTAQGREPGKVHRNAETWTPAQVARSGYRAIAVVRNPYARAVSLWHQKIVRGGRSGLFRKGDFERGMPFVEFLRLLERMDDFVDLHLRAQWCTMYHRGRYLPDMVIRLEDPEGWAQVRALMPELPDLPHRNASDAPDWAPLVAGEAGEIIRRRYARDFELFGYPR